MATFFAAPGNSIAIIINKLRESLNNVGEASRFRATVELLTEVNDAVACQSQY